MKRLLTSLALVAALLLPMAGCSDNDFNDKLPEGISQFLAQYFPGERVNAYTKSSQGYNVGLSGGETLQFDNDQKWTKIYAYGESLGQELLYDQLSPILYNYLQTFNYTNKVWGLERDVKTEKALLPTGTVTLTYSTGLVTYEGKDQIDQ